MNLDVEKIDEAALALLYLTVHEGYRAWKGLDWEISGRLHAKALIEDPVNKSKSVMFTDEGLKAAERACQTLFSSS